MEWGGRGDRMGGMGMQARGRVGPVPQIQSNWEAPASMHMAKSAMAKASK